MLLYPTVSDYWNSMHATAAIAQYSEMVNELDEKKYAELIEAAAEYNRVLSKHEDFPSLAVKGGRSTKACSTLTARE